MTPLTQKFIDSCPIERGLRMHLLSQRLWSSPIMTNHDPVMADIIHLPEYLELSD